MTLDVLICTIDNGIIKVPDVLLPPKDGIRYVVSMQYTSSSYLDVIPKTLLTREDVTFTTLEGKGLSRNRNNAISQSSADIILIADDDNRYTEEYFQTILDTYEKEAEAAIICFAAESLEGKPMKTYPKQVMPFTQAFKEGYYPMSIEMTFRHDLDILFDERFGLGSELLCAGEEDIFMKDALDSGYEALFVPKVIVRTPYETTGSHFLTDSKVQITKGAVFRYLFGVHGAIWRSVKESLFHLIHNHANPFTIFFNMMKGIWILQS